MSATASPDPKEALERLRKDLSCAYTGGYFITIYQTDLRTLISERDALVGEVTAERTARQALAGLMSKHLVRATAAEAKLAALEGAARYILPYLRWTVGPESPGHHPTMPSAVVAFQVAFDLDTPEKRTEATRRALLHPTVPVESERKNVPCSRCGCEDIQLCDCGLSGGPSAPVQDVAGLESPDAYLRALLDYTSGFYGAAIAHGMKSGPAADAVQHVERAARNLHRLALHVVPPSQGDGKPDDTELDGTDFAHPAYWRGSDAAVEAVCQRIEEALDGNVSGISASSRLQALRERCAVVAQPHRDVSVLVEALKSLPSAWRLESMVGSSRAARTVGRRAFTMCADHLERALATFQSHQEESV